MADAIATPTEVVQEYCRGVCADLLEMMRETHMTVVSIVVNDTDSVPSMSWRGIRRGSVVFSVHLFDDECPTK